jgi:hypothetical protein
MYTFTIPLLPPDRGWVGWKNDKREFVEIIFEFDAPQELHTVQLYSNNQFTRDVAVFAEVRAYFSVGGQTYHPDPVSFSPLPDEIFEEPRNVSASLQRRIGRFVRLELYFAAKWILISEVSFDSSPARGNYTEEEREVEAVRPGVEVAGEDLASSTQMPVIVGCLATVIVLLAAAIFFIVSRSRARRKLTGGAGGLASEKVALQCPEVRVTHDSMMLSRPRPSTASPPPTAPLPAAHPQVPPPTSPPSPSPGRASASPLPCPPLLPPSRQGSPRPPRARGSQASLPGSPAPRRPPASPLPTPRPGGTPRHRKRLISNPIAESHPLYMEPFQVGRDPPSRHALPPQAMRRSPYVTSGPRGLTLQQETGLHSGEWPEPSGDRPPDGGDYAVPLAAPARPSSRSSDSASDYELLPDAPTVPAIAEAAVERGALLSQGAFGTVETATVRCRGYLGRGEEEPRLAAVKWLPGGPGEEARGSQFQREVAVLAGLADPHIARVLGAGPHFVVMVSRVPFTVMKCVCQEYLEHGDLAGFLSSHLPEDTPFLLPGTKTLSFPTLVYIGTQVRHRATQGTLTPAPGRLWYEVPGEPQLCAS